MSNNMDCMKPKAVAPKSHTGTWTVIISVIMIFVVGPDYAWMPMVVGMFVFGLKMSSGAIAFLEQFMKTRNAAVAVLIVWFVFSPAIFIMWLGSFTIKR